MGEFSAASSCQRIVQEHPSSLGPRGTAWSLLCGCRISLFMYKETEGAGCWWLVRWLIFLLRKLYPLFFFYSIGCLGENANHHKYCNCNKFSQNWNACDFKMCDCKLIFLSCGLLRFFLSRMLLLL